MKPYSKQLIVSTVRTAIYRINLFTNYSSQKVKQAALSSFLKITSFMLAVHNYLKMSAKFTNKHFSLVFSRFI